jgi:PAS domain S-box-containing protein
VSPFVEQLLGYSAEVATGDPEWWAQALHPDDRERMLAEWTRSDETGEPYAGECRLIAADGRTVWIRDEAVLLRDDAGEPVHWQGVMLDITDAKQANDDLTRALDLERQGMEDMRRADEIKTTFRRLPRHPDTALCDPRQRPDPWKRGTGSASRKRNGMDTERLARGVVEPKLQEIAVGRLVSLLVWDSDTMAGRQVHMDTRSVTAWVDPQMISRIVENLLMNAARHTPPGCQVWVRVVPEDGNVLIVVEDDGPGLPEEHRESISSPSSTVP